MKKIITPLLIACSLLIACNSTTPEKAFGIAALNCNLLYGFAGSYELKRDLGTPQEKLVDEKTMKMAPVTRAEVIKEKLTGVEENYEKVKGLSITDDNKEMLNASTALYEYVLPVYKKEYTELAALYDAGATADKIEAMQKSITEKYEAKFLALYNAAWEAGKAYAAKHGIQVREVNPSPSVR
jgi:hypothetical protein